MAWVPTATAPLNALMVFSGCSDLYPLWAMVCGKRLPLLSLLARVQVAVDSLAERRRGRVQGLTHWKRRLLNSARAIRGGRTLGVGCEWCRHVLKEWRLGVHDVGRGVWLREVRK